MTHPIDLSLHRPETCSSEGVVASRGVAEGERELDGLRLRRRLAPQDRGTEVEEGGDELAAIVQRCPPDDLRLQLHERFTEAVRLRSFAASARHHASLAPCHASEDFACQIFCPGWIIRSRNLFK